MLSNSRRVGTYTPLSAGGSGSLIGATDGLTISRAAGLEVVSAGAAFIAYSTDSERPFQIDRER